MENLDRINRKTLRELQVNGRISYVDLGSTVGLSTSPCIERVRRLEREGFIQNYTAKVDPHRLNAAILIFVQIKLKAVSPDVFEDFRRAVTNIPYIQECHFVSGSFDYLMKVRIESMNHDRELLGEILRQLPGVKDTESFVVVE
ncbi:MAG: Lrp/AsnC ligand binding domain-containing protein [Gammaproteobacteria bacterium]|nr:Lrp/AsnC ligand binding domain-containing protein [Gammaproteobacteria bacterium]